MLRAAVLTLTVATFVAALAALACAEDKPTSADSAYFESKIRPLLAARCFECHAQSAKQLQGGLQLDTAAGISRGGDSGPVVVSGRPDQSLLIEAVRHTGDIQMPPTGKLPAAEIALLTDWVRRGTPLPGASPPAAASRQQIDFETGREFWSFQPLRRWPPPAVPNTRWSQRPLDPFVLASLAHNQLGPSQRADAATLIPRLSVGLLGLPPAADDVERFVADNRPDATERLIDRLLAAPQYGERWGRYWLDLARYADGNTTSLEVRGQAWLYRDWVVRALNADLPYDEFVRRQLAADHLPELPPAELAALGFLGLSPEYWKELKLAPGVIQQIVADEWEERIDAIGRTFLGLSLACARCHDHKFDPISTEDYYALAGVLASTHIVERYVIPEPAAEVVRQAAAEVKEFRDEIKRLTAIKSKTAEDKAQLADLEGRIQIIESSTPHYHAAKAHAAEDAALYVLPSGPNETKLEYRAGEAIDLCVHIRGNPAREGPQVPRRFLTVLSPKTPEPFQHGSGRRELADAILQEGAPLAARVIVNRVWKLHFGRGLVETTSDFGTQGARPTHPELLDDLTSRFVEQGWSLKWLHREILQSTTYQQASTHDADRAARDPDNRWLWRMSRRRLDVEAWRDSLLAACAHLNSRIGGPSQPLADESNHRRTLYAKIDRAALDTMLRLFDFPDAAAHSPNREPTTTALQQLFVLNSPFMQQQAAALAEHLLAAPASDAHSLVSRAYRQVFSRPPSPAELRLGAQFLDERPGGASPADRLQQYLQALLGSNEFLYVD